MSVENSKRGESCTGPLLTPLVYNDPATPVLSDSSALSMEDGNPIPVTANPVQSVPANPTTPTIRSNPELLLLVRHDPVVPTGADPAQSVQDNPTMPVADNLVSSVPADPTTPTLLVRDDPATPEFEGSPDVSVLVTLLANSLPISTATSILPKQSAPPRVTAVETSLFYRSSMLRSATSRIPPHITSIALPQGPRRMRAIRKPARLND